MNISQRDYCDHFALNGTVESFMRKLKTEVFFVSPQPLKRATTALTTEAMCTICVMLLFVLLAVIGSSITACESFLKVISRKHYSGKDGNGTRTSTQMKAEQTSTETQDIKRWSNIIKTFFNCFCVITNGRKILSWTTRESDFGCIHGIRVLAMNLMIGAHCCTFFIFDINLSEKYATSLRCWSKNIFMNSGDVNNVFFVISGLLNGYFFSSLHDKTNGIMPWKSFYIYRYVRLTPVYMIVLWFYTSLSSYTSPSPSWPAFITNSICTETWWWNLLYINNFKPFFNQCMMWSWYLACDMQFHIISPLFLVTMLRRPRIGYTLIAVCICGSCLANFMLVKHFNLVDGFTRLPFHVSDLETYFNRTIDYLDKVYEKPFTRINTYLVGMVVGCYVYRKRTLKNTTCSKVVLYCGWIFTAVGLWISNFAPFLRDETVIETAVLIGVRDLILSCCISWIIFICLTGQGGFINNILSAKIFIPFSRLTYSAFLINYIVIYMHHVSFDPLDDANIVKFILLYPKVFWWTYLAAFVVSLLCEQPTLRLLRLFSMKPKQE